MFCIMADGVKGRILGSSRGGQGVFLGYMRGVKGYSMICKWDSVC